MPGQPRVSGQHRRKVLWLIAFAIVSVLAYLGWTNRTRNIDSYFQQIHDDGAIIVQSATILSNTPSTDSWFGNTTLQLHAPTVVHELPPQGEPYTIIISRDGRLTYDVETAIWTRQTLGPSGIGNAMLSDKIEIFDVDKYGRARPTYSGDVDYVNVVTLK